MLIPPENIKTVLATILAYGEAIDWTFVSREEAEQWRTDFPTRSEGENARRNARAPFMIVVTGIRDRTPFM